MIEILEHLLDILIKFAKVFPDRVPALKEFSHCILGNFFTIILLSADFFQNQLF